MFSVTRSKAGLISRLADYLQFRTNPKKEGYVAGQRLLGGTSASQSKLGVFYPTVQSAIDDLTGRCDLPVDSVLINTSGTAPRVISQSDQLQFTGEVTGTAGSKVMMYILGLPFEVDVGDPAILVASKALAVLTQASVDSLIVTSAELDASDSSILNITYNDYQDHIFEPDVQNGITITQTTVVEPLPGYGQWEWLGSQAQTLAGGSVDGVITLYYFKRVA